MYCTRCGSIVDAGASFCGACGARVSSAAPHAAPTQQLPTPSDGPSRAPGGNRTLTLVLGLAAVLLVLAGIGAIVGLALVGNDTNAPRASANEPAPANDPEPTGPGEGSTKASQPAEEQELEVGDSVEAGGVEATLNGVRVLPTTDGDRPVENPDNRFFAADLTFENVSEGDVSVSSLVEFVLKNGEGYSASQTFHSGQKELAEGEIGPGQKASGEIVYEVPPGSRGLQLDYRPFARGDTYTWVIGDLQNVAVAPQPEGPAPPTPEPTTVAPVPSESEVAEAAEEYYLAVDREDWGYTYANLDAATRTLYPEDEWYLKNQYFADTEGLELATIDVVVETPTTDPAVGVTVFRTFEDGTSIDRSTLFVQEDGAWRHRLTAEENTIFQPGVPYEEFVAASSASAGSQ